MKTAKKLNQQIFYTSLCFFYLISSIYQLFFPLAQQDGDSFGVTIFNPIYIYSVVALVVITTAMGFWNILGYWVNSKKSRSLFLFITTIFTILLTFVSLTALLGLATGLSILALTKKNIIDFIYTSTLPILFLVFTVAGDLFRLFGITSSDAWLPGIVLSSAVNLILVFIVWYYSIFKLKNAQDDSQSRNSN